MPWEFEHREGTGVLANCFYLALEYGSTVSSRSQACLCIWSYGSTLRSPCSYLSRYLPADLLNREASLLTTENVVLSPSTSAEMV